MTWVWILAIMVVLSWGLEGWLSYRDNNWHGLVLPVICFAAAAVFIVLNLLNAFPETSEFGSFLVLHGTVGLFAVILKVGFLFTPAAVHLIVYFVSKHYYRKTHSPVTHNKEYKKMLADDL